MAQIIGSISTEYGLDLKKFHSDLKKIKGELKKLEKEAQKISINVGTRSVGGGSARGGRATGSGTSAARESAQRAKDLQAQSRATRQAITEFERLDQARFKAQLAQTDLNGKIQLYEQRLNSVAPATKEYYKNQEQLAKLNQRAANSSRGLAASLQSIGNAAGALGIGFAATEIASLTKELVQYGNEVEDTITSTKILAGSQEEYARILALARKEQRLFGTSYTEAVQNATNFSVVARNQSIELERLFNVTQRLASSDTQQGIEGASIALKELFSGSSNSLKLRFETFSADQIKELGASGLTANERLALLDETLNELGFTQDILDKRLENTSQSYRDLGIAVDEARQKFAAFAAEGLEPAARGLERLLSGDTDALAEGLRSTLADDPASRALIQSLEDMNREQEIAATLAQVAKEEYDKLVGTTNELAMSTGNATDRAKEQLVQSELNVSSTEELVGATELLDSAGDDLSSTIEMLTTRFGINADEARNLVKDYQDLADAAKSVQSVKIPEGAEVEAGTGNISTRGQQEGRRREQEFKRRQKERKEAAELAKEQQKEEERLLAERQREAERAQEEAVREAERAAKEQVREAERAQKEKERLAEQAARELERQREEEQRIFERQQNDLRKQAEAWRDYYKDRQRSSIDFQVDRERAREDFEQERRRLLAEGQIAEADRLTQEFEKEESRAREDFSREQAREREDRQREAALEQEEFSREYGATPIAPVGTTTQSAVQQQAAVDANQQTMAQPPNSPQPLNIPMNVSLMVDGQKLAEAIGEEMTEIVVDNLAVTLAVGETSDPANGQNSNYRTTRGI